VRRALVPALLLALAAALWWLALASASAQLEARARAEAALYAAGGSPFDWQFSDADAVVGPPLGLIDVRVDAEGLSAQLPAGDANIGLRLSGRQIDPEVLGRLRLQIISAEPLQWRLLYAPDLRPDLDFGPIQSSDAGQLKIERPLAELIGNAGAPLHQLRLQLMSDTPQRIQLQRLTLLPAQCGDQTCLPARIELPGQRSSSHLLANRDARLQAQPQLLIGANAPSWLIEAQSLRQRVPSLAWLVIGLTIAGAAALASRRPASARQSGIALAFGAALPIVLLALGLPDFPAQAGAAYLLVGWLIALWLLRPRAATRPNGKASSAWLAAIGMVGLGMFMLMALRLSAEVDLLAPTHTRALAADRLLRYAAWAGLQQLWLARFVLPHIKTLGLGRWTLPSAALLFAGLHLPNTELMALTALGGLGWAWLAQRYGRLLPQTAAHAVLGIAAIALLPEAVLRSAEIGGRFVFAPP
jgi:hypothetical protein